MQIISVNSFPRSIKGIQVRSYYNKIKQKNCCELLLKITIQIGSLLVVSIKALSL